MIAQAEVEGVLFGGVVARERPRLGEPVVVAGERLDDDRAVGGGVEDAPAALRRAVDADEVLAAVAGAVAGGDGVGHGSLPSVIGDAVASRWIGRSSMTRLRMSLLARRRVRTTRSVRSPGTPDPDDDS